MLRILIHLLVSLVLFAGPVLADPPASVLRQVLDQPLAFRTTFDGGVVSSRLSGSGAVTSGSYSGAPSFYAPTLSSGNLTVGKVYQITARSTADFTADGAAANTVGTYFVASGTSVTLDANNTVVECSLDAENLITNGGFETAGAGGVDVFAGWNETVGDGAITQDTTPHYGTYGAKLTAGAAKSTRIMKDLYSHKGEISEFEYYVLSYWTRGDGTYAGRVWVYDVTHNTPIVNNISTGITDTSYVHMYSVFQVPSGCTAIYVGFYCPSTATGIAYFDDTSLRKILPGAELLADPDFDNAGAWNAGTGWGVADGMASHTAQAVSAYCRESSITDAYAIHTISTYLSSYTTGGWQPFAGVTGLGNTTVGVKAQVLVGSSTEGGLRAEANFVGAVNYVSIRRTTLSTAFSTARLPGAKRLRATITTADSEWAGAVMCLDSQTSPANFVVAIIDHGNSNKVSLWSVASGAWTQEIAPTTITYGAGYMLQIKRAGDVFSVWYGPDANSLSQVGTDQTITGMTGNYHGLFGTGDQSTFGELRMQ